MPAVHHIASIEALDDISPFETGLFSGAFCLQVGHDGALHIWQPEDFSQQRRDVLSGGAEEPPHDAAGLDEALHGRPSHVTGDGKPDADTSSGGARDSRIDAD